MKTLANALTYAVVWGLVGAFAVLCLGGIGIAVTGAFVCVWGVLRLDAEEQR